VSAANAAAVSASPATSDVGLRAVTPVAGPVGAWLLRLLVCSTLRRGPAGRALAEWRALLRLLRGDVVTD